MGFSGELAMELASCVERVVCLFCSGFFTISLRMGTLVITVNLYIHFFGETKSFT